MNNNTAIYIKNVSKSFRMYQSPVERLKELLHPFGKKYSRDFWALKNINLDIPKGTTVGIIGKNGSGKSTLLKIITNILQPSSGTVQLIGRVSALLELGAGFDPEFTGRENVFMNGAISGISREEMEDRFEEIVSFADIGEFIEQPVKTYSSGMYVRLAFATAINVDPDVLIVDEVLAVGDLSFAQKCMDYMLKFFRERTVVLVSHRLADIKRLCKKVVVMDKGVARYIGPPEQAILEYYNILERDAESKHKELVKSDNIQYRAAEKKEKNKIASILIKEVQSYLVGSKNNLIKTNEIEFSKPFELQFIYEINIDINRPEFRISFNTIDKSVVVCSSSSLNALKDVDKIQGYYRAFFRFPNPLLFPREYMINAAICDQESGFYYFSEIDIFRLKILYPITPIFEDMESGTGITHMNRNFHLESIEQVNE